MKVGSQPYTFKEHKLVQLVFLLGSGIKVFINVLGEKPVILVSYKHLKPTYFSSSLLPLEWKHNQLCYSVVQNQTPKSRFKITILIIAIHTPITPDCTPSCPVLNNYELHPNECIFHINIRLLSLAVALNARTYSVRIPFSSLKSGASLLSLHNCRRLVHPLAGRSPRAAGVRGRSESAASASCCGIVSATG